MAGPTLVTDKHQTTPVSRIPPDLLSYVARTGNWQLVPRTYQKHLECRYHSHIGPLPVQIAGLTLQKHARRLRYRDGFDESAYIPKKLEVPHTSAHRSAVSK